MYKGIQQDPFGPHRVLQKCPPPCAHTPSTDVLLYLTEAFAISHTGHLFAQADMAEVQQTCIYQRALLPTETSATVCYMGSPFFIQGLLRLGGDTHLDIIISDS